MNFYELNEKISIDFHRDQLKGYLKFHIRPTLLLFSIILSLCKVKFELPCSAPCIDAIEWIVVSEFKPLLLTR